MTTVTVNGNTYSDDGSTPKDMQNGGFRNYLLPMLGDTMVDTSAKVSAAADQVALANAAASAAAISASTAVSGPGSNGTSTTSLTMALGVQSLTIQTGKTLSPGMPCTIASTASPRNWMNGSIDSYNSGTGALQVYVTSIGLVTPGVYPTLAAWTISLSGPAATAGVLNEQKGSTIATASTINLDAATGNFLHLTGSVTVNAVTLAQGAEREVVLDAAPIFANSANLILPTGANIQGAAGDIVRFRGEGSGVVRMTGYLRASGAALSAVSPGSVLLAAILPSAGSSSADALSLFSSDYDEYHISVIGAVPSTLANLNIQLANVGTVDSAIHFTNGANFENVFANVPTSGGGGAAKVVIVGANNGTGVKMVKIDSAVKDNSSAYTSIDKVAIYYGAAVSGFRLLWSSGTFAAGTKILVHGVLNH